MKLILIACAVAALNLVGCGTMDIAKDPPIVVKYKYVITTIPGDLLDVPPQVPDIDPKTADDKAVGKWMLDGEKRSETMEDKLNGIKQLQEQRIEDAQKNLPKEDIIIK